MDWQNLPSLGALRAFHALAENGTFTRPGRRSTSAMPPSASRSARSRIAWGSSSSAARAAAAR